MNFKNNSTHLPEKLRKYFWDCDFDVLNMDKYSFFIAERILNLGDDYSIKWLLQNLSKEQLQGVVDKSRNLDKKTKNYWRIMFNE